MSNALFTYTLRLADDLLVLSHRLSEWCGHGPVLEEDIALTNRALDHLGEARNLLQYAGQVEGQGRSDDDLAFLRNERQYRNVKLVEQPNGDYAHTIARSFLFDAYHLPLMHALLKSKDDQLVAIAGKAVKEATYHLRHSSEWMVRFGDGTDDRYERLRLRHGLALVLVQREQYGDAAVELERLLELADPDGDGITLEAFALHATLATVLRRADRVSRAVRHGDRAVAIAAAILPADSPPTIFAASRRGQLTIEEMVDRFGETCAERLRILGIGHHVYVVETIKRHIELFDESQRRLPFVSGGR